MTLKFAEQLYIDHLIGESSEGRRMTQLSDFFNSESLLIELTDRDTGEFKEVKWTARSLIPSEMSI
jgi:hypothetical protein